MLLAVGAVVGCNADPTVTLDANLLCRQVDSVGGVLPVIPTLDDQFEALATVLPGGFGGSTAFAIVLVNPDAVDSVRAATEIGPDCPHGGRLEWALAVRQGIIAGDYDFIQLRTWRRAMDDHLDATLHVVFTDADEARNRVFIGVDRSSAIALVRALASRLGVPSKALVVDVVSVPVPQ